MVSVKDHLKEFINEYEKIKDHDINYNLSLILWGIFIGILLTYTYIFSLLLGVILGYICCKYKQNLLDELSMNFINKITLPFKNR